MKSYTLKISTSEALLMMNDSGNVVPLLELLREASPARVFAFEGQMGAGKTTFIRQLCHELGSDDVVNSPTFAIVNVYEYSNMEGERREIYHFDCYRLKDIREAMDFGAEEYLYSGEYCFIEWPEVIEALLPEDTVWLKIEVQANGERLLCIESA